VKALTAGDTAPTALPPSLSGLSVGTQIQMIRGRLGMNQSQLAQRARITKQQVIKIESGAVEPRLKTLRALYEALGCEMVVLPVARVPLDEVLSRRATKAAKEKINQVLGTMALEAQPVSKPVQEELVDRERDRLLKNPSSVLWAED
jgi:predicted DNA-binding mobile mystery protein A